MLLLLLGADRAIVHTVVRGDTLWSIGRAYGVTVTEILAVNAGIASQIEIGQKIAIPLIHIVVRGDTLSGIGRRYLVTVAAIMAANPVIKSTYQIKVGQRIIIPKG